MSGIYIPGMEMPNGCFYCIFNKHLDPDTDICRLTRDAFDSTFRVVEHRRDICPIVPVPEHGRLIDADVAIRYLFAILGPVEAPKASGVIAGMPTIIPASPSDKEEQT